MQANTRETEETELFAGDMRIKGPRFDRLRDAENG
jgi:hypothetical protein